MLYLCGCYYHVASAEYHVRMAKHYLPLLDSQAHSTILSTTSRTVLKQTFTNPSSEDAIKECIYTFPLYDGVSVVSFTCRIGSKILRGLVQEKVKAKAIFDEAVAKGETAGLLEQALEASDVFSTKLGNIPAGSSVVVEITYIGELKHHETDGIRFTIPTSIAPRYGSGPLPPVYSGSLSVQDNGGIKITVDVSMPEGSFIKGIQSPSHPIAVSMGTTSTAAEADPLMSKASATLSLGSTALEKDFVLIVQAKDVGMPKAVLEFHPTIRNHRALMATLVPKFSLPPSRPEIVFVADRSGSMAGNIAMLVSAMKVFLKSLPVGVKFNICSFGSSTTFLWQQSKGYTQETLHESTSHVETFLANMGGTETFHAIKATVERRFTDLPLEIILLTDGDIWQQEDLFTYVNEQVAKTKGKIRIFPLGIGNGVSHALIEGLARAGNGFAQSVQLGERLDNCVVRMLRGALSPHITDYTLEVKYERDSGDFELIEKVTDGMKVLLSHADEITKSTQPKPGKEATISLFDPSANPDKDDIKVVEDLDQPNIPHPKLLQSPHKIPTLFSFSRSVVYLLMSPETIQKKPISVVLRATSAHGPLALEIPVEVLSTPAETIHQLAAKKAVQDLEEGRGWIFDAKDQAGVLVKNRFPSRFEDLVKKEAVRLGEKYQIAGKWCSFVAVSANDGEIAAKHKSGVKAASDDFGFGSIIDYSDEEAQLDTGAGFEILEKPTIAPQSVGTSYHRARRHFGGRNQTAQTSTSGMAQLASTSAQSWAPSQVLKTEARMSMPVSPMQPTNNAFIPRLPQQSAADMPFYAAPLSSANGPSGFMSGQQDSLPQSAGFGVMHQKMQQVPMAPLRAISQQQASFHPPAPPVGGDRGLFGSFGGSQAMGLINPSPAAPPAGRSPISLFGGSNSEQGVPGAPSSELIPAQTQSLVHPHIDTVHSSSSITRERNVRAEKKFYLHGDGLLQDPKYSSAPSKVNWKSKSATEKVLVLISLQDFEGWWPEDDKEVADIMGLEVPKSPLGDQKAWVTMLVVCFLEQRMSSEEGTWELIVEKARGWLASNVQIGLQDLEREAREFVKGN